MINIKGECIYVSPSAQEMTGYTVQEFYSNKELIKKIIHPEDQRTFKKHEHEIDENGLKKPVEFRIITKSGKIEWIDHDCKDVYDSDGKIIGIRGSNRIITEKKKLEKELNNTVASKDKFISIISHDLRSPFNSLLGFSEMMLEDIKNNNISRLQRYANFMNKAIINTYSLLNNLLMWAQSQGDKIDFNPKSYTVKEIIKEPIDLAKQMAESKSINLTLNLEQDFNVYADKEMLETVLRNLFSNAVKFTPKGGKIELIIERVGNLANLSVVDNGVGIDKHHISKLFKIEESFSSIGTRGEKGFGLGLLLCKEFVKKNKGRLLLQSEVGIGSKFTIELPIKNQIQA
ncbi:PAS domain-containing sensor histidine kinase [Marinifilum sp. D714]|nr:PAS domain-containing sensor histidine kinase [Marinifilum sp. D714]